MATRSDGDASRSNIRWLLRNAAEDGRVYLTQREIAARLGKSLPSVKRYLRELRDEGAITVESKPVIVLQKGKW